MKQVKAYVRERRLSDVVRALRADKAWEIVDPIVERWESEPPRDSPNYAAGSAGPESALELMRRDGRRWREQ